MPLKPISDLKEYAERIQGRQVLIENGDKYLLEHVPSNHLHPKHRNRNQSS